LNSSEKCTLTFTRSLGRKSKIITRYSLEARSSVIKIQVDVDWQEKQSLLKIEFPTGYKGRWARFGSPFGSILRSQQPGLPQDEAMWEVPGSRYAAVCEEGEKNGLFLVTEAKYGFSCRSGNLGLSLLRSVAKTGFDPHHAVAYPPTLIENPESPLTDIGTHQIKLAVGHFNTNAPREEQPAALADILYTNVIAYKGQPVDSGFLGLEGGTSLQPSWAKPAEDRKGWILRLHETQGCSGEAKLLLGENHTALQVDLLEKPLAKVKTGQTIVFQPYEILSIRIARA
jgi:alpha-mannosidase